MINDYQHLNLLQNICKKVKECGATSVHVAGGAVRDSLLNKPIKDIDVFYEGELEHYKVNKFFKHHMMEFEEAIVAYETNNEWQVKYGKLTLEDCAYPIQLIKVVNFPTHMEKFAAGISKCWVDEAGLHLSTSFLSNEYFKTVEFTDDSSYTDRIRQKYSDWDFSGTILDEAPF